MLTLGLTCMSMCVCVRAHRCICTHTHSIVHKLICTHKDGQRDEQKNEHVMLTVNNCQIKNERIGRIEVYTALFPNLSVQFKSPVMQCLRISYQHLCIPLVQEPIAETYSTVFLLPRYCIPVFYLWSLTSGHSMYLLCGTFKFQKSSVSA